MRRAVWGVVAVAVIAIGALVAVNLGDDKDGPTYAIVLPDGSYGPAFPSLDKAAAWGLANLPADRIPGWVDVAVTEDGETAVSMGITLSR